MTGSKRWMRDAERMLAIVGVITLIVLGWQRLAPARPGRALSPAEVALLRKHRPPGLVFPGAYPDTIELFIDYTCVYCAALYPVAAARGPSYGLAVHYVTGNTGSPSFEAAMAAECARRQGRFHQFSYELFARRDSLGVLPWRQFGAHAGISDLNALAECIGRRDAMDRIVADRKLAEQLHLRGTPSLIDRGRLYTGPTEVHAALQALSGGPAETH